jgi:hypothetical protein
MLTRANLKSPLNVYKECNEDSNATFCDRGAQNCSGSVKLDRILPGFGFRRSRFFSALRLEFCRGQIA